MTITRKGLAGLIRDTAAAAALGIKGHITVELIDDRTGRTVDHREADNYVNTAMWEEYAKVAQKGVWVYGYQGDALTVTNRNLDGRDPRVAPTVRNDHIALWADTTPEDPTDLWPFGEIIAWAHRWPQGSPSTRQGLVQPTLCTLTEDAVSWVWEWTTVAGNGNFQSAGWRRLNLGAATGDHLVSDVIRPYRRLSTWSGFVNTISLAAGSASFFGSRQVELLPCYYNSADGNLYAVLYSTPSGNMKLVRCPVTFDAIGNYSLGTVFDESANVIASGLKGNSPNPSTVTTLGITRLGPTGDWIAVGTTGNTTSRRPFISRTTPAGVVSYTNANAATYTTESGFIDATYDGTNLWVLATAVAGGANAIHRIDPATGTISATISAVGSVPAYFPVWNASNGPAGIEWDPANGWLWISDNTCIYNINTSGVWQGVLFSLIGSSSPAPAAVLSGLQGVSTQASSLGSLDYDLLQQKWNETSTANSETAGAHSILGAAPALLAAATGRGRLFTMNGGIWTHNGPANTNTAGAFGASRFDGAPNFASRTDLGSPVTKTNTQTMRLRYTITFT